MAIKYKSVSYICMETTSQCQWPLKRSKRSTSGEILCGLSEGLHCFKFVVGISPILWEWHLLSLKYMELVHDSWTFHVWLKTIRLHFFFLHWSSKIYELLLTRLIFNFLNSSNIYEVLMVWSPFAEIANGLIYESLHLFHEIFGLAI